MSPRTAGKRAQRRPETTRYEIAVERGGLQGHHIANVYRQGEPLFRVEGKDGNHVMLTVASFLYGSVIHPKGEK